MNEAETPFVAAARAGRRIGHAVEVHAEIGSTSDRARELLAFADGPGTAVVAEVQLAGRGRRGRTWTSPPGRNLMMSVGLAPHLDADRGWQLSLAAALAALRACRTVAPIGLKWPNDLVASDGRKVGGILVETAILGDRLRDAIVGVGINVNWADDELPAELAGAATSLGSLADATVDRGALLGVLLDALDEEIGGVEHGSSPLERYRAACTTLGARVTVETGGSQVVGVARELDAAGALVVDTEDGPVTITSGEVVRLRPAVPA